MSAAILDGDGQFLKVSSPKCPILKYFNCSFGVTNQSIVLLGVK